MKKILIMVSFGAMVFTSCKTSQLASIDDDIYANPAEQRELAKAAAVQKAKLHAQEKEMREQEALAQKTKDDNNPYYKDPQADQDDYYDYKYASRINRFDNPINGAGYYDSRYTNYYTYNQNPAYFGSSIYSSYSWMPSNQFNGYSTGISLTFGNGYGYNNYNNYGYYGNNYGNYGAYPGYSDPFINPYTSCGYYGSGYYGYVSAYSAGYYNGYNAGSWGYFNSLDANSGYGQMQYGHRGSSVGGNAPAAAGKTSEEDNSRSRFFQAMNEKQENTPRFTQGSRSSRASELNTSNSGLNNSSNTNTPRNNSRSVNNAATQNNNQPVIQGAPRGGRSTEARDTGHESQQNSNRSSNSNNGVNNGSKQSGGSDNSGGSRGSGGGGSSPRGSGSGGGRR